MRRLDESYTAVESSSAATAHPSRLGRPVTASGAAQEAGTPTEPTRGGVEAAMAIPHNLPRRQRELIQQQLQRRSATAASATAADAKDATAAVDIDMEECKGRGDEGEEEAWRKCASDGLERLEDGDGVSEAGADDDPPEHPRTESGAGSAADVKGSSPQQQGAPMSQIERTYSTQMRRMRAKVIDAEVASEGHVVRGPCAAVVASRLVSFSSPRLARRSNLLAETVGHSDSLGRRSKQFSARALFSPSM